MLAALASLENSKARQAALQRSVLPYFPYAAKGSESEETLCPICVEPLRQGQHCSEVPACRHAFHRGCLDAWARTKGTCPMCRAKIVPGSNGVTAAEDMV
ncbi:hypothetical protein PR202_gb17295 [Eleusine coracana subsp. coracana]|uniref:RING-type domain-containing protein n=1 Tax=Eleusine coracana subsp. coracana TaxID=191504 RepID=A0AAV5F214_ELECO|nr:hypothetical protein PR202_gb17295 [Eleusine coracana subsp. coracana]